MGFISTSIEQIASTSSSATYRCTVSVKRTSYFGKNPATNYEAIKDHNGSLLNYIGWPKLSDWSAKGLGTPNWDLSHGNSITAGEGTANGYMLQDYTYSFERTVSISRGNKRKGSITIYAGCVSKLQYGDFQSNLASATLSTTEIALPEWSDKVNKEVTKTTLSISRQWKNVEGFYTARILDANGVVKASDTSGNLSVTIPLTKEMYGKSLTYFTDVIGRDGSTYKQREPVYVDIPKQGVGLTVKNNGIHEVDPLYFKNVSNKEPKEVWIKINGEIKQTIK